MTSPEMRIPCYVEACPSTYHESVENYKRSHKNLSEENRMTTTSKATLEALSNEVSEQKERIEDEFDGEYVDIIQNLPEERAALHSVINLAMKLKYGSNKEEKSGIFNGIFSKPKRFNDSDNENESSQEEDMVTELPETFTNTIVDKIKEDTGNDVEDGEVNEEGNIVLTGKNRNLVVNEILDAYGYSIYKEDSDNHCVGSNSAEYYTKEVREDFIEALQDENIPLVFNSRGNIELIA